MTIRFKLTMGAIAAILVANSLLALVNFIYLERNWQDEVQTRVRLNLNSARSAYGNHMELIARALATAALDRTLATALEMRTTGSTAEIEGWAKQFYRAVGMDLVLVLDADGKVLYRARNPAENGDSLVQWPLVAQVVEQGDPARGTVVLSAESLRKEGDDLADRAAVTSAADREKANASKTAGTDGMLVAAAIPILNSQGKRVGILYGGDLLNNRNELVDVIKDEVFPADAYEGKQVGSVTIFLGDMRIATNVLAEDGRRAVGTRMSEAVHHEVIECGGVWTAPAKVVNDWYITAYEPIRDPQHRVVGALYVGLLQAPFVHAWTVSVLRFIAMMIVATTASLVLIFLVTLVVMRPVEQIVSMSERVIAGDFSARVGIRPSGEMGALCRAVDNMADALAQREEQLKQVVRQQVSRAEKLASIGRLAAGVAHEINNPLTGVLTFAHLMREKANMDDQDRQDLDLIVHETTRAADIVRGLLDFARERPVLMEDLNLNEVVERTVRLIANQKKFERIDIEEQLQSDLPQVRGDMNQLQQVLLNLSLNACAAMPQGGQLVITTSASDGRVVLTVADTGCGIKEEYLERIFEPFFTTQEVGKGTGLGLSVTYGIIEQHNGELKVQSQEGQGSAFIISLPALPSQSL